MDEFAPRANRLTPLQWLICGVAALGFAFDLYESVVLAVVVRPALAAIGGLKPGTADFNLWVGLLLYVPAMMGGIFGLLGGYLTDVFGRRRVLVRSILLYALSAWGASYSTNLPMLLIFRCTTSVGVCVEYVAAVAWLAELFIEPRQRESVLGYTQSAVGLGGLSWRPARTGSQSRTASTFLQSSLAMRPGAMHCWEDYCRRFH